MCFGDTVFAIMTITDTMMDGMRIHFNLNIDRTVSMTNEDSRINALVKNRGSPMGIPIAPTTLIEPKMRVMNLPFIKVVFIEQILE